MNKRPNLLIIQTDQQSTWTLSCYGGTLIHTPNIDSIAEEGALFNNFFTNSAVCTPSRGSFITGRFPHFNGAYRNGVPIDQDQISLAHLLKDNSYETAYIGKWHLDGDEYPGWMTKERAMGFDECEYMFNCGHYKKVKEKKGEKPEFSKEIGDEETYMTDWLANKTIDYLTKTHENKPFFLMVSIPDPHQPYNVRAPYDTMYNPEDMPIPESFYQEVVPDWAEEDEWGRKRYFPIDQEEREEKLRHIKAQYCGEVKCIDDNVGRILAYLKEKDILENTIIAFTTDHGEYMGEHGLLEKNNLYDSVYRIPLLIRWPEKIKKGIEIKEFVNIVDFQQTVLGIMDLEPCGKEQGIDASPLLLGQKMDWKNEAYVHPNDVPRAGIITPEYELAYVGRGWQKEESHEFKDHVLFDRRNDPNQMNNLFDNPTYQHIIEGLTTKIVEHHKKLGSDISILPTILQDKFNKRIENSDL